MRDLRARIRRTLAYCIAVLLCCLAIFAWAVVHDKYLLAGIEALLIVANAWCVVVNLRSLADLRTLSAAAAPGNEGSV